MNFNAAASGQDDGGAPVARGREDPAAIKDRKNAGSGGSTALPRPGYRMPNGQPPDAEFVVHRLEEAGITLLGLPASGFSTRLRTSRLDVVQAELEGYGWDSHRAATGRLRPPAPDSARIGRMDEALAWLGLMPQDRYVLRRIVGARSLVSPATGRHLFSWRRLGTLLGADHKAIQRWHAQGVDLLVARLRAG